jgi:hypothetical protein
MTEVESVSCAVRTESLYKTDTIFFKGLTEKRQKLGSGLAITLLISYSENRKQAAVPSRQMVKLL